MLSLRQPLRLRLALAGLLGVAVAVLATSCGSSGKGLIPAAQAGPLQSDFEMVAQAAQTGNGNCAATQEAIAKTEQDFQLLPATVDPGLHARLRLGIANLASRAREMCLQPTPGATTTTTSSTRTTTQTTSTTTTSTQSTPSTTTTITPTTTTPGTGGGTPAPSEGEGTPGGDGNGNGKGHSEGNGAGAGGTGAGNGDSGQGNGQGHSQGIGK